MPLYHRCFMQLPVLPTPNASRESASWQMHSALCPDILIMCFIWCLYLYGAVMQSFWECRQFATLFSIILARILP